MGEWTTRQSITTVYGKPNVVSVMEARGRPYSDPKADLSYLINNEPFNFGTIKPASAPPPSPAPPSPRTVPEIPVKAPPPPEPRLRVKQIPSWDERKKVGAEGDGGMTLKDRLRRVRTLQML
jgi:hypothetical protein